MELITTKINHCCGSCHHWEPVGGDDFKERLKFRFRRSYCRLNKQPQEADSMRGCLVWQSRLDKSPADI